VLRLLRPTAGRILFEGRDLAPLSERAMRPLRRHLQIVFQDPFSSLDPRQKVEEIVAEPLRNIGHGARSRAARVAEVLERVGLPPEALAPSPLASGGAPRLRIAIGGARPPGPKLIVCDEAVSALDVSVQAQVVNLLGHLQTELGLSYLFVAHDLAVVRHLADRVAVMHLGRIVETASAEELFRAPLHPYTQALLSASPIPDPVAERGRRRIVLAGELPDAVDPPSGCHFRTRCWKAQDVCAEPPGPELIERGQGHPVACLFPDAPERLANRDP
jgi:oligopeptide/dipeptide ABC transporter ATP-binding protein